jgi:signal transduction histidine kinase
MFASIRSRLLFTYVLLIAAILGVVTLALLVFLVRNPRLAREAELNLSSAANALQRQPIELAVNQGPTLLANAVERADELLNVRVALFDPGNALLADSRSDSESAIPPQATQRRPRGGPQIAEFTDSAGKIWIYTTRNLQDGYLLLVSTTRPRAPLVSLITDEFFLPIVRAGFLALLLSLLLAFFMTRWITSPLQRVSAAAQDLAKGQMRVVTPEGPAELQSLARTFNEMGQKVQTSQQSQRDFVANISHELRTPLTSIQGFAQAILDGTAKSGEILKQSARVIYDEAGRMHRLVLELLELTRLDAGGLKLERREIDISALLRGVAEKLTPQAQAAKIDLQIISEDLPSVQGDHDRLVQVFTNLVDNALKHAPKSGHVRISAKKEAGFVVGEISDDGPGIPAAEAKRVFERFYQVDKSRRSAQGRGSGLGLSIASQIVQAHGGKIELRSELGKGTRFLVYLPLESGPKRKR